MLLGKGPMQGLDNTTLTVEKEYSINFTKQQKKFCLSLQCNRINSYILVNDVEIYKCKTKDSEIITAPLCLSNVSKYFSAGNVIKADLFINI